MVTSPQWTVIGIFETQEQAREAMIGLQEAGFTDDQLGFVYRDNLPALSKAETVEPEETPGAFTGGIAGGILGAADALLTPVLGPSVASTIPVSTESVVEQVLDRFQHTQTDEEKTAEGKSGVEQQGDRMAAPSSLSTNETPWPDGAAALTGAEERLEGEDASAAAQTPPVGLEKADAQRIRGDEATGAITGGIVGGVLGVAVSLLIPVLGPVFAGGFLIAAFSAALGALTGGFLGAFVALGVPEEEARHYEHEFTVGRTILTVKTADRQQEALAILHRYGARYANAHERE